mmetsp:Transcript_34867/g.91189  ORF Transcript_34867/g.91189 Transcript_34867/m.91189 type:complete len:280 (-) Transcript_34867:941-1780(-)
MQERPGGGHEGVAVDRGRCPPRRGRARGGQTGPQEPRVRQQRQDQRPELRRGGVRLQSEQLRQPHRNRCRVYLQQACPAPGPRALGSAGRHAAGRDHREHGRRPRLPPRLPVPRTPRHLAEAAGRARAALAGDPAQQPLARAVVARRQVALAPGDAEQPAGATVFSDFAYPDREGLPSSSLLFRPHRKFWPQRAELAEQGLPGERGIGGGEGQPGQDPDRGGAPADDPAALQEGPRRASLLRDVRRPRLRAQVRVSGIPVPRGRQARDLQVFVAEHRPG